MYIFIMPSESIFFNDIFRVFLHNTWHGLAHSLLVRGKKIIENTYYSNSMTYQRTFVRII